MDNIFFISTHAQEKLESFMKKRTYRKERKERKKVYSIKD